MPCNFFSARPRVLSIWLIVIAGLWNALPGQARVHASVGGPVASCEALNDADFSQTADAPSQIAEAKAIAADTDIPRYCRVSGYVAPSVGFILSLPDDNWNGKFIQLGCGGFCGSVSATTCGDFVRRGYACIVSDNGHKSAANGALWAYNNLQAEIDHGYRAAHVTALTGKAIVKYRYGRSPQKSYFMGNSTGGRQALIEAQRFPWDFDGIVAGVPSISVTGVHMNLLWGNRALTSKPGEPLITQKELDVLHRAVIEKCDLNDGIKDDLIGDPRGCGFDPRDLQCRTAKTASCLTGEQIEAVRAIYGGPVTSTGESIYMPGALKGSEATWVSWFIGKNARATYDFVREEFRYSAFQPNPGPSWKPEDFDFDRDYKRFGMAESISSAANPDLRQFKAAGGKLLMWAGWSDAAGMPLHTVDYYETVERLFGGRAPTQDFFRLFMLPGVEHGLGAGAFAVDWLSYLEAWVENGQTPQRVISSHVKHDDLKLDNPADAAILARRLRFPLNPGNVDFSRPAYPYPTEVKYQGRGNPSDPASFTATTPDESGLRKMTTASADRP
jgi:hypothetical protein